MRAVEVAFGLIDVGLAQRGPQIFQTQAVGRERRRIGLNAHGGPLPAADADEPDARKLRNFLRQRGVGQIFHFGKRQRGRSQREREDRRVGRIDLAVDRRIGQILRQQIGGGIDGGLHFLLGDVDVQVEPNCRVMMELPNGAGRGHLVQAGDLRRTAARAAR